MDLVIADTYAELSALAAAKLIEWAAPLAQPLISPASGDSPAGLYQSLVRQTKQQETDTSHWHFVGLDEWAGMNGGDEGSCRYHLDRQLFGPLRTAENKICFFDGRAADPDAECSRADLFISQQGGIDVAILGLGMNGHIGMNEPGSDPALHSHVAAIHPLTQQVGQKYFTAETNLSSGLTLGIATLLQARHILLIVSGAHKAPVVQELLQATPSVQLPASLLLNHPGLVICLDKAAAQLLPSHG